MIGLALCAIAGLTIVGVAWAVAWGCAKIEAARSPAREEYYKSGGKGFSPP